MPPAKGTRKRAPGTIERSVKLGLTDYDATRLTACMDSIEAEFRRPVSLSKLYSVALAVFHHRLLVDQRERAGVLQLLRY
jgi:hypothetical protein